MEPTIPPSQNSRVLWGIFLALICIIIVFSLIILKNARQSLIMAEAKTLQSIAQYKSDEIRNWLKERTNDALVLMESHNFPEELNMFLDHPDQVKLKNGLKSHFFPLQNFYGYQDIMITDSTGRIYLSLIENEKMLGIQSSIMIEKAFLEKNYRFSDFYYCERHEGLHIDFYAPVFRNRDYSTPRAMILLRINPATFIYPLLQSWPLPSKTSETLLVRKQNDSVIYLNELRHQQQTALKLKLPITNSKLPVAMAARGTEGFVEGQDYRNKDVLSYILKVEGTPWYLVSKTDRSEVLSPMKFWTIAIVISAFTLILFIGFFLLMILNQRKKEHFKSLYEIELQKEVLSKHYEYLMKYANDIILLVERGDHKIVDCNEKALQTYGYSRKELIGMKVDSLVAPSFKEALEDRMREIILKKGIIFESAQIRKDGSIFPIELSARSIEIKNRTYIQSIIRDITERKKSEQIIFESETRFRSIFENAPIGIGITRKGKHLFCNQTYAGIFGFKKPDELLEIQVSELIHPDHRMEIVERNKKRENNLSAIDSYETIGIRKDGNFFPFFVNTNFIIFSDGPATLAFIQDLTHQKKIQASLVKSEKRYRMLFSSMVEGFALHEIICDKNGKAVDYCFLDINPAFERLTGLKAYDIIGRNVKEILPNLETEWIEKYGHVALTGEPITFEQFNASLDRFYRVMAFSPGKNQFAVLFEDITESRKIHEEIKQLNLELEQRVKERTISLEIANKELESFSYSVSHDLRAPLRSLDGFSQALLEDYFSSLNEQGQNYLRRIRAASQKMSQLIDDMLNLSRVSRQNMKIEIVDVSEMVTSICHDLILEYPSKEYILDITPGVKVSADPSLLKIALYNLLNNAFKFSNKVDQPKIRFGILSQDGSTPCELFICDNGAGFDMKYAGKLFGVFQRLHTTEEFPGTGIGLTIVHRIIQRHEGAIRAESKTNEGACFYFRLPKISIDT